MIVDMSGSMAALADDVRGGFNTYVENLRADSDRRYRLTVCLFDTEFIPLATAAKLRDVPKLNRINYAARGSTALLDAVGKTITEFDARVPELGGEDRVLLVVQTDGAENASREFTRNQIANLIKMREASGKWTCLFLGAGIDAWAQAGWLGFQRVNTVSTQHSTDGYAATYASLAGATRSYARGGSAPEVSEAVAAATDEVTT